MATGALNTLASRMASLRAALPGYANSKKIEVVTAIHDSLIQTTPVDTGMAMSNWPVSLNAPEPDMQGAFVPSPRGRMLAGEWTRAVEPEQTRGANILPAQEQRNVALESCQPGDVVFIANNLPYIQRLNEGSSTQAPAGFVDAAVVVGTQKFENASDVALSY